MKPAMRLAGIGAVLLALAGCQQEKAGGGKGGATDAGEILPGSASDAMLPYDTVRSQPPLAPRSAADDKGKPGTRKADTADEPVSEAAEAPTSPAPAPAEPASAGAQ